MKYPNIYSLFRERVEHYRRRDAAEQPQGRAAFYFRQGVDWAGISWERFESEAHAFGCALLAGGLTRGASVCVLMGNVPEWPISDIGAISAGGIGVGLYPTSSAEQCQYIINHSDAEFVLVDTAHQLDKILSVRAQLPKVKAVIALDEAAAARNAPGVIGYQEFLRIGRAASEETQLLLRERAETAKPDDIAIMVYTSGTTGLPKGACLSHRYIINSVESLRQTIPIYDTDVSFSYLPYCHVAERISGLYNRLYAGASAYFVDDLTKLWEYMLDVRPTVFASLPRFFEKIHARVISDLEKAADEEQRGFHEALALGRRLSRLRQARETIAPELQAEYDERARPVLSRVNDYFGGRMRLATSGGAPLPFEITEFFDAAGIPILQAYGLTENICVAFNPPDNYKFGTVGPPMPGCEVELAEDGEILVRSDMMFSGYYKQPDKTAEALRDGWLLTGDIGEMDADRFLKITGRKKELIVMSTGKNVAPALIENLLREHHLISHALVYGEGRSYLVALVTLNPLEAEAHARARGLSYEDFADLTRNQQMLALVREIVERVNSRVSSSEAVKKFLVLDRDFQIEADEVTPTMKVKRNVVTERYGELIHSMYA
ncbi:MAG: long-chain acyl-CoA synthetase [Blastocatellia bacterium]|jgi:long-chain acyl-CoA synthetase|nr:long-chain acyl-CoA synthetase [Blastocatellia bacterium]